MMATVIEEFDAMSIKNVALQFIKGGTKEDGKPFGCVGTIGGETEMKELIKRCEGIEAKKTSKPQKHNLTVSAHVDCQVLRDIFGLKTDGLKTGVYSYGTASKGANFVLTADVIDEFEDVTKMIAFPNCSTASGLKINIENGADEVAEIELEFTALADDSGELYYEAFVDELEDDVVKTDWHKNFNRELVEA
ncbi:phage tail protein (plasmid) [Bacillus carboniphilus]|uniref:Phage tail protein n=1 Tax=Bacillus carboniphilus TaxID=86663 RepID=A0ABY9K3X0_9BACI|nr:phage tail protein [Bacillus carboniphilus]WLR44480.1 phage tail protein [Bacillus carboniphilus]